MSNNFFITADYQVFISQLKQSILHARNKAVRSVNSELINLYFNIGKQIVEKQKVSNWGEDLIGQIEHDLKTSFPDLRGFSRRNLNYMRKFYNLVEGLTKVPQTVALFQPPFTFVQQLVAQIPWGHIRLIIDKTGDVKEANFYFQKTIENSWSRVMLEHQISLNLYKRQGKLISNFDSTVDNNDITLIKESFKESYVLDFLELGNDAKERDLERVLIQNITNFILELGKGFAFVGKQYKLTVGRQEFFIDLLFYNYILKRFVVLELKNTEFKPEYVGQIGFYITAINRDIKSSDDKSTIGLIVCRSKNNTVVEYALANSNKPTGVAEYKLLSELPEEIRQFLPTGNDFKAL